MESASKKIKIVVNHGRDKIVLEAKQGELLLDVLRDNGVMVPASCGGKGTCDECRVNIVGGESVRSCQYKITGDIEIALPEMVHFVILDQLNPHARRLKNDSGITANRKENGTDISYKGKKIATIDRSREQITAVFGLAVDIGTTTVVLYLVDLSSYEIVSKRAFINPQGSYGADVISRIEYTIREEKGLHTLRENLIHDINKNLREMCRQAEIPSQRIFLTTVVGNTVMLHILLGADPAPIAFAPYTPAFTDEKIITASQLNLNVHPDAVVRILPSLAGYVGADIVAGAASTDLMEKEAFTLYIDIGTNGEIVLGNREILYSCATAAGPAFEGARIQCGVGGVPGAISEYTEGVYKTIAGKKPVGICGSGLVDIVAYLLENNHIDFSGVMEAEFCIEKKEKTGTDHDIVLTQKDVREVQLAKAAIYAGIKILMDVADITFEEIENVYLAGGFGNFICPDSAIRIGLLPAELKDRIIPVGNSAGTGALQALQSITFEKEITKILDKAEYIELSMRSDFNDAYVEAMFFPDKLTTEP